MSVLGTRPEAIKMAPVIRALEERAECDRIESIVCATGQHREMLDQVLSLFGIDPDYDLAIMEHNQSLNAVAAAVLTSLEPVLAEVEPDWVLVQGDTTSVAMTALAAFHSGIRVGHVEAGLRTGDKQRPFPEEVNRRLAGVIADLHFAPTPAARENLLSEGTPDETILVTGNPVIDALRWVAELPLTDEAQGILESAGLSADDSDEAFDRSSPRLVLVTAHRRESFGEPIQEICLALRDLATRYSDCVRIVYAVHRNPNIRKEVHNLLGETPGVILTDPLDYRTLVALMKRAHLVLTDSGGIQEEAPSLGIPVFVLREVTERPEAVAAGAARLVGTDRARIFKEVERLLMRGDDCRDLSKVVSPYGDGRAAERIVRALVGEPVTTFSARALRKQTSSA